MRILNEELKIPKTNLTPYGGDVADNNDDDLTRIEDMASFEHEDEADIPPFEELNENTEEYQNEDPPAFDEAPDFSESTFSEEESFEDNFGADNSFSETDDSAFEQTDDSFFEEPTDPNIQFPSEPNFGENETDEQIGFQDDEEAENTQASFPTFDTIPESSAVFVEDEMDETIETEEQEEPVVFQEMTRTSIQSLSTANEDKTEEESAAKPPVQEKEKKVAPKSEPIKLDPIDHTEISKPAKKLVIHSNILDEKKKEKANPPSPEKSIESTKKIASSDNFAYAQIAAEGNPAFSVILKDIQFQEDADDILRLLKEFKVIKDSEEDKARAALNRGSFLIPRVGEYVAIYLCQKLRKFNINILMGLSDEIHASDLYDRHEEIGLMSKENVFQNRQDYIDFVRRPYGVPENIIVSTSNYLENYKILEHLGVITEYTIIDTKSSPHYLSMEDDLIEQAPFIHQEKLKREQLVRLNRESSASTSGGLEQIFSSSTRAKGNHAPSVNDIYKDLTEKLKQNAISSGANGIVGISFHITPIFAHETQAFDNKYRITATGNLVWLKKK